MNRGRSWRTVEILSLVFAIVVLIAGAGMLIWTAAQ